MSVPSQTQQVFVESLDRSFPNVCELDLVLVPLFTPNLTRFSIFLNVILFYLRWCRDQGLCSRQISTKLRMLSARESRINDPFPQHEVQGPLGDDVFDLIR